MNKVIRVKVLCEWCKTISYTAHSMLGVVVCGHCKNGEYLNVVKYFGVVPKYQQRDIGAVEERLTRSPVTREKVGSTPISPAN